MENPEAKTVLVVDDEPDIVFFLKAVLEDHGFRVMTALNGQEASDRMRRHPPDLISLDLIMPGKSGIRFFHELRKNKEWSKIPVLFVSGHVRETIDGSNLVDMLKERTLSGPATYLEKPVNAQTYIRTINSILGLGQNTDEQTEEKSSELQHQVESLLSKAPSETLERVLQMLKENKKGG
jgi:CheY-like chemotaxis protein